jgi:hypothetical protein
MGKSDSDSCAKDEEEKNSNVFCVPKRRRKINASHRLAMKHYNWNFSLPFV